MAPYPAAKETRRGDIVLGGQMTQMIEQFDLVHTRRNVEDGIPELLGEVGEQIFDALDPDSQQGLGNVIVGVWDVLQVSSPTIRWPGRTRL